MGEFWGFVDWGAGCLALIVAVVFSFLLGVRTGRIRERNESVRSRIRQNKANMYRYKQQLASYQEQVVRLERERDSLVTRVHSSSTESRTVPARLREVVIKYQPFLPQEAAMTESHGLSPQI